ncbi:hypothetical protein FOMPIDRAFT_1054306 [Fomitopsis schrenkii]|uniref:Cleavage/polyadenylation specificity factor A subunit N-terminal domain-containing protein n=1 Tax=Fomitopsis schrenkii TaxID=2126942 RepID=S8DVV5_FOMSC|nr:hypothetical protein FOMPIDRAFT_1054306 [Fomitopsis schrenkii]
MSTATSQSLAIEGDLQTFYVHEQYVLTFTTTSVDVWRTADEHGRLDHAARLASFVECPPYGLDPIIDTKRDLIIIADRNYAQPPSIPLLLVFGLTDGKLIRMMELYGTPAEKPLQYANGKVLVAIEEEGNKVPPEGLTTVLLCDVAGDGGRLGGITLPKRLRAREQSRLNTSGGILLPVQLMPNGDIIATSSEAYNSTMEVLRYRAADVSTFTEPDAHFELATSREIFERIQPTCSGLLDEHTILMAVYEADDDQLPKGDACQTAIYAVDTESMTVRWRSDSVGGMVTDVRYVAALDAVVAFGAHDNGTHEDPDPFAYVLALDPATGVQRRMETVGHRGREGSVQYCGLAGKADDLIMVVVFSDASVWSGNLRSMLEDGPAGGSWLQIVESLTGDRRIDVAGVAGRTVILSVNDVNGSSSEIRFFPLE